MLQDNISKRRYYLNKRGQNSPYLSTYNSEYNKYKGIKLSDKTDYNKKYTFLNSNSSEPPKNLNFKNYLTNKDKDKIIQEKILFDRTNNKNVHHSKENSLNNSQNINNSKTTFFISPSIQNKNLNKTNNNINKRYFNNEKNQPDYSSLIHNNYVQQDFVSKSNNNIRYHYFNDPKYKKKNININNYDYNKIFTNQTYDLTRDKIKNNINNSKEEKKYSLIVMQKNKNNRFSSYSSYNERKKIIKIQSAWRGYFLRKIAVGSIKKYIGFVALMKYSEKIIFNNKKYIFDILINLLKKYTDDKNLKYKYRRINKTNCNDYNEKNNNNFNRRYHRNFLVSQDKNEKKDNNQEKVLFKNNYLFNNVEFEPTKKTFNDIKRNSDNNKRGVTIYFVSKEKEKEQRKEKQTDNEKEGEKRRIEKEKRQKEKIDREKEKENEKKRLEKIREENEKKEREKKERLEKEKKELKEKREKELKERLERIRFENEKREKEKEKEKEKEIKLKNYRNNNIIHINNTNNINNQININNINTNIDNNQINNINDKIHNIYSNINTNNINNNDDDIFSKPIKIIYVPKKLNNYSNIKNNNRYYYRRISNEKKNKIEKFKKYIYKKCYKMNYPIFLYQLKLLRKINLLKLKINSLDNIFKLIQKKYLKNYLKIYRENVLNEKVKEEILKKNMNIFKINKEKYKIEDKEKINNKNQIINKYSSSNKKQYEENEIDEIILEDNNENENEEEINNTNNINDIYNENKKDEKIILRAKRKYLPSHNKISLLSGIINKKIKKEENNNIEILKKYIKIWKKYINAYKDEGKPKIKINLHSPDMEIRGNKSKKKHIKVKFSRALTSKTSIGSIKSEGKSNSSSIQTKKMRIKNIVVNPTEYITTTLFNNSQIYNNNISNKNKIFIKLFCLLDKIDNKNMIFKCFKYWKKNQK